MKKLNVTVQCLAVYNSAIEVPDEMSLDEAIDYAQAHLDDIPLGPLEYVRDSDQLDLDNCDFDVVESRSSLDSQIQAASIRVAESRPIDKVQVKESFPDR